MPICKYCKYYEYKHTVNGRLDGNALYDVIHIGECELTDTETNGNLVIAENEGCGYFIRREPKYNIGDVFKNDKGVVAICNIQLEYAPRIYRVRSNRQSEWSMSEGELIGCKQIWAERLGGTENE